MDSVVDFTLRRGVAGLILLSVWSVLFLVGSLAQAAQPVTFVFTSDVHFGITRGKFRGEGNVDARTVNTAMVAAINGVPAAALPSDGGLRAGQPVGPVDFVIITGDITNRQERLPLKIQSSAESWAQFEPIFFGGLKLTNPAGQATPLLLVPGNHDVSNAIGHPNGLLPTTDATSLTEIYNRMVHPATPRTKDTYRFATDKIRYSRDFGGAHFVFVTIWPDAATRAWIAADLNAVPETTPVFLFAHDPPEADPKHFEAGASGAPVKVKKGKGKSEKQDKAEGVIPEPYADGPDADGSTDVGQRAFVAFLRAHRNISGYFHGHSNWNEFYTWKGPDNDIALPTFRADSPMKGKNSADETKLSFQVVVVDVEAKKLTSRECLWNSTAGKSPGIAWGESTTVRLAGR